MAGDDSDDDAQPSDGGGLFYLCELFRRDQEHMARFNKLLLFFLLEKVLLKRIIMFDNRNIMSYL